MPSRIYHCGGEHIAEDKEKEHTLRSTSGKSSCTRSRTEPNYQIRMQIEDPSSALGNALRIFDGDTLNWGSRYTFLEPKPRFFHSTSHFVDLAHYPNREHSDITIKYRRVNCGGDVILSGIEFGRIHIRDPGSNGLKNRFCVWNVSTDMNNRLKIKVFGVQNENNLDWVRIFHDDVCGCVEGAEGKPVITKRNSAIVMFYSHNPRHSRLSLELEKACEANLRLLPSDAGGLLMQRVPQYRTMRLEEVVCQLIWQHTQAEASCSMETLLRMLQRVYLDLQLRQPTTEGVRAALVSLVAAGAVYFNGRGYSLLTAEKLAVAKWLENVPEVVSLSGVEEEEDLTDTMLSLGNSPKAPLAEAEPYPIRATTDDSRCNSHGVNNGVSPASCQPYAVSPIAMTRSIDQRGSLPQPLIPGLMHPAYRSPTSAYQPVITPPVALKRHTAMPTARSPLTYASQPILSTYTPSHRARGPRTPTSYAAPLTPQAISHPIAPSFERRRVGHLVAIDTTTRETLAPGMGSQRLHGNCGFSGGEARMQPRAVSADALTQPGTMDDPVCEPMRDASCGRVKGPQTTVMRWLTDQFRRLRSRTWQKPTSATAAGSISSTHNISSNPVISCIRSHPAPIPSDQRSLSPLTPVRGVHCKSHFIAVPPEQQQSRGHGQSINDPHCEQLAQYPGGDVRCTESNLGSLRRCLSLADDSGNFHHHPDQDRLAVPRQPSVARFSTRNHTLQPTNGFPTQACISNYPSVELDAGSHWISHPDLITSPSYLSLVVRPDMAVTASRDRLASRGPMRWPSHSTNTATGSVGLVPHPTMDWSQPIGESLLHPSPMVHLHGLTNGTRKRPATRDSGFVESAESSAMHTGPVAAVTVDRSAPYSVSPLSKSSDGAIGGQFFHDPVMLHANQSSQHVWWTTGFQQAIPTGRGDALITADVPCGGQVRTAR